MKQTATLLMVAEMAAGGLAVLRGRYERAANPDAAEWLANAMGVQEVKLSQAIADIRAADKSQNSERTDRAAEAACLMAENALDERGDVDEANRAMVAFRLAYRYANGEI